MKITFIYPDLHPQILGWPGGFYTGIASLSSVLKKEGHETSLIHVTQYINKKKFIDRIKREDPDLIGLSSTSHMFPLIKEFASWLVEAKINIPTIYGGVHPTIAPEESIAIDGIDLICRGEGESPLIELCNRIENKEDMRDILNLWVKTKEEITRNPLRPLRENLDILPFPDRSIFDYKNLWDEREGVAVFLASKGCPYNCTYCTNHMLRKIYGKGSEAVRFRSVDNVIAEIKQVLLYYPYFNTIIFHDDIFFLKRSWAEEFSEKYRQEINLPFICNARADVTNADVVNLLKAAGCSHIKFGLESGNEEIRSRVLNRHMADEQIKKSYGLCKKAGLTTMSFNMVGIPFETPSTILDTIKLNASIGVDIMEVSIFQPYPGTKLGIYCREQDLVVSEQLAPTFTSTTILKLNSVSHSQILMFKKYFSPLARYYQKLQKLPVAISNFLIGFSDRILSVELTSKVLILIHDPLKSLYLRIKHLRVNSRLLHRKSATTLRQGNSNANNLKGKYYIT